MIQYNQVFSIISDVLLSSHRYKIAFPFLPLVLPIEIFNVLWFKRYIATTSCTIS